jgi:hypothetical protein
MPGTRTLVRFLARQNHRSRARPSSASFGQVKRTKVRAPAIGFRGQGVILLGECLPLVTFGCAFLRWKAIPCYRRVCADGAHLAERCEALSKTRSRRRESAESGGIPRTHVRGYRLLKEPHGLPTWNE